MMNLDVDFALAGLRLPTLYLVCMIVSSLFLLFLGYYCARQPPPTTLPNYAFTASTKVGRRAPTVLQFSARVPPSGGATPTILQTFDLP